MKYKDNELLLGTDNGLYVFNRVSRKFRRGDDPSDIHSLSDEAVNSMLWDAEGALWVLTNLGGANYMSKQTKRFNYNSPSYLSNNSGTVKLVGPLCENKDGGVWVGTRNGLRLFDTSNERFINDHIIFNNKLAYDIRSLMQDGDYLWVGTYTEGLKVINVRTGSMKQSFIANGTLKPSQTKIITRKAVDNPSMAYVHNFGKVSENAKEGFMYYAARTFVECSGTRNSCC